MQRIHGKWNGTGAAVWVCCGVVPDELLIEDIEITTNALLRWHKGMCSAEMAGGMIYTAADVAQDELTSTEGIEPYLGGETLVSGTGTLGVGTITYGEGVYLKRDDNDYRYLNADAPPGGTGDASSATITNWTLDTSANRTGHFNGDATGTYIGEGSKIIIDAISTGMRYEATITALTAGQGESSDEVTLSLPVPSGKVRFIGGMYGFKPMTAGMVTPAGFKCNYAWTNNNTVSFIATNWDL